MSTGDRLATGGPNGSSNEKKAPRENGPSKGEWREMGEERGSKKSSNDGSEHYSLRRPRIVPALCILAGEPRYFGYTDPRFECIIEFTVSDRRRFPRWARNKRHEVRLLIEVFILFAITK